MRSRAKPNLTAQKTRFPEIDPFLVVCAQSAPKTTLWPEIPQNRSENLKARSNFRWRTSIPKTCTPQKTRKRGYFSWFFGYFWHSSDPSGLIFWLFWLLFGEKSWFLGSKMCHFLQLLKALFKWPQITKPPLMTLRERPKNDTFWPFWVIHEPPVTTRFS